MRDVILAALQTQLDTGVLVRRGGLIDVGPNAPVKERRAPRPTPLEALIAEGENAHLEFKESLRWDVRQTTVNKKLEDVAIKTVAALANHKGGTLLIGGDGLWGGRRDRTGYRLLGRQSGTSSSCI